MKCNYCGSQINANSKYCNQCGKKVFKEKYCPNCNSKQSLEVLYCDQCGVHLVSKKERKSNSDARLYGNTFANLFNGGYAVGDNDYDYLFNRGKLYRIDKFNSRKKDVIYGKEDNLQNPCLNSSDEFLYFIDNRKIISLDKNTLEFKVVIDRNTDNGINLMAYYNGWLYFSAFGKDYSRMSIYKAKVDGSNKVKIKTIDYNGYIDHLYVEEKYIIYCIDSEDNSGWRICEHDGSNNKKVTYYNEDNELEALEAWEALDLQGGRIIRRERAYEFDLESKEIKEIYYIRDYCAPVFWFDDVNTIVFNSVYEMLKIKDGVITKLTNGYKKISPESVQGIDNWIYCRKYGKGFEYRVKIDGSEIQELNITV